MVCFEKVLHNATGAAAIATSPLRSSVAALAVPAARSGEGRFS